jgi:pimeloyl-ACP methyl ester carboxylesterase
MRLEPTRAAEPFRDFPEPALCDYNRAMTFVEVAGRRVYYELHEGPRGASALPLLLLNGIGGSCRGWLPLQVPELSKSRSVLIFDHRGVGDSDDPGGPFGTDDLAEDTAALLDALEIQRADILGAFMGGMAAQELAIRHPSKVHRLVLVGSYSRADAKRRMLLEDWATLSLAGVDALNMLRERLVWTLTDETLEQTDLIESMIDFFLKQDTPVPRELFMRQCQACLGHDTSDRLADIQCPTLILCGRQDQLTPPKLHRALAEAIPNSRLVVLDFGAHLVMAESAIRFNQTVLQFLDDGS